MLFCQYSISSWLLVNAHHYGVCSQVGKISVCTAEGSEFQSQLKFFIFFYLTKSDPNIVHIVLWVLPIAII